MSFLLVQTRGVGRPTVTKTADMMVTVLLLVSMLIQASKPVTSWSMRQHHHRPQRLFSVTTDSFESDTMDLRYEQDTLPHNNVADGTTRRNFVSYLSISVTAVATANPNISPTYASYINPQSEPPAITKRVWLDVEATGNGSGKGFGSFSGRIVIGLFGEATPKLVDNFVALCESNAYAVTSFYRVLSDFSIQGGAIDDPTGRSGKSATQLSKAGSSEDSTESALFPDNYNIQHTKTGLISMVSGVGGTVDSRFFINVNDNGGWGDDRYAAFGIVEGDESMALIKKIEQVKVKPPTNKPVDKIMIVRSGVQS